MELDRGKRKGHHLPHRADCKHKMFCDFIVGLHRMPSNIRFLELMRCLRFVLKTERRSNLLSDKFAVDSQLKNSFIENLQKVFFLSKHSITVDEQLLPCYARCKFIQHMSNKPNKLGLKF